MFRRLLIFALAALALVLSTAAASAQQIQPQVEESESVPAAWKSRHITIKAGATYSDLRGELDVENLGTFGFSGAFGFALGASYEISLSDSLSLQPELLIVRKFSEIEVGVAGFKTKLGVNYIEFPLLLKWYVGDRSGVNANFVAGPTPALKLSSERESRRDGVVADVLAGEGIQSVDWGATIGVGLEFEDLFSALTIDLRYTHGLKDVNNEGDGASGRWRVGYILLGVKF